jgi:prevent-host-death family protein
MKTHQLQDARASLSRLIEEALKGEPQRVTRRGRDAVVIVSEADWLKRSVPEAKATNSLRDLLLANPLTPAEWRELLEPIRAAGRQRADRFSRDLE